MVRIGKGLVRTCSCASIDAADHSGSVTDFAQVRDGCSALREVLIPDSIWAKFQAFCSSQLDEALHTPVVYLAFQRRQLAQLTTPVHEFCLRDDALHPCLTTQYRNDLVERWMFQRNHKRRFELARTFQGRLWELVFAFWLRQEGWQIEVLEALGGTADIVAMSPRGAETAFEIKHLGKDEMIFDLEVRAFAKDGVAFEWPCVYSPVDYLLFRVYEASKQLSNVNSVKVTIVLLDDYQRSFKIPLSDGWIDWQGPKFLRRGRDIEPFLQRQYAKIPGLDSELQKYISHIDEIWFLETGNGFALMRRKTIEVLANDRM